MLSQVERWLLKIEIHNSPMWEINGTLENSLFNGTFKHKDEIEFFIQHNGGHISVDNRFEIPMLEEVAAAKADRKQPVIMRHKSRRWS